MGRDDLPDEGTPADPREDTQPTEPELPRHEGVLAGRVRRVSWGALIRSALLLFAVVTLVPMLLRIDWRQLRAAAADASLPALVAVFVLAQVPRPFQALSTLGSVPQRLPFGPVYVLQLAMGYLNVALPNAAARMALAIRFFNRQGVAPATAVTSSLIDSFIGNLVQIVLLVVLLATGTVVFDDEIDFGKPSGPSGRLVVVLLVALAAFAVAVVAVPRLRRKGTALIRSWIPQVKASWRSLGNPRKLALLLGGTLGAELVFALVLLSFTHVFGGSISLPEALIVNIVASLLASVVPVPGGIGVVESALIVGLSAVGVDEQTAFAAAMSTRLATFYLPPLWGWASLRWLSKRGYV